MSKASDLNSLMPDIAVYDYGSPPNLSLYRVYQIVIHRVTLVRMTLPSQEKSIHFAKALARIYDH